MSKLPTSRLSSTPAKASTTAKSGLRPPQQTSTNANVTQQVSPPSGDTANNNLSLGDRVMANGKQGTIAFIGPTKFAEGEWIGVILDEVQGKNDGSYEGTRYFETEANRGLFCRAAKVQCLTQNGANSSETPTAASSKVSAPTSNVDKTDADTTLVNIVEPTAASQQETNASVEHATSDELHIGDRVVVSGTKFGTLKYLGKIHVAEGIWCGIELDDPLGKNDGSVSGKRYFSCQQRYGLFSPLGRVEKVSNEMTQSQIIARKASVSSSTNAKSQLHRSGSQESLHSNLSEFSTSSNSISRIPTRPPAKIHQQKLANNSNLYSTSNTKSLLTQAAATLAAVTPSSNQVSALIQAIKEKDIAIEKLQAQAEQDRLEFSRAAQQVDEIESRLLTIKQQLDTKEAENEQMKKEQYQTNQRLEDLEFQLEEYKLTDTNKEHATTTSVIPDGHRLLTPKDIQIYEEVKQKVLELETTNQKLVLEKQTLQDEHRQELKRQNELIENEFQGRINELEKKFNDTSKTQEIELLKSQITDLQTKQQSQTTEKDTQFEQLQAQSEQLQQEKQAKEKLANELALELKNYQENLLPELEKKYQTLQTELTDLRNQDQTNNLAVNERDSQFQQQIQDYQTNLNQAIANSDTVRNELKQIQEENHSKEQQFNEIINQLKQDHEKVQIELNQQEQRSKSTVSEYDQQIKDLQTKFEQTQLEFTKLQEEKVSSEKKFNETINSLKQDCIKAKTELQDRDLTQNMALNEREIHYENQVKDYQNKQSDQLQKIEQLQNDLDKFQEEKDRNEKQHNKLVNQLKQNHEKVQTEFNQQEEKSKSTISQYEQQIKDLQAKFEQTQLEFTKLQEEKASSEKQLNDTINSLKENQEKIQSELNDQEKNSKCTLSEYEQQIKDLHVKLEQIQVESSKFHEEKTSNEKQSNETINSLKQDYESQLQSLQTKLSELEVQNQTKRTEFSDKDQQIQDYQSKLDRLSQENTQLQTQFNEKTTQFELLQSKISELQAECQKQLTSNENIVNEKQSIIDQLNKQIQDMQQVESELIEKQVKQHTNFEQEQKILEDKIQKYKQEIQSIKTEFLAEKQNIQLAHEQEKLILKQTKTSNQSSGNVKQFEYELAEARFQITKLEKQLEINANKDDRSTLESQVNFLNGVIVELRNKNEKLTKEIEFLKNPFAHEKDEGLPSTLPTNVKSSAPRLYCDMCEVFDQHDTDDCPKQSSLADDQPSVDHHTRERVLPPPRAYCEKCEEFGHDCNDNDETY